MSWLKRPLYENQGKEPSMLFCKWCWDSSHNFVSSVFLIPVFCTKYVLWYLCLTFLPNILIHFPPKESNRISHENSPWGHLEEYVKGQGILPGLVSLGGKGFQRALPGSVDISQCSFARSLWQNWWLTKKLGYVFVAEMTDFQVCKKSEWSCNFPIGHGGDWARSGEREWKCYMSRQTVQ